MTTSSGSSFGSKSPENVCVDPKKIGPSTLYVRHPTRRPFPFFVGPGFASPPPYASAPSDVRAEMRVDCFHANESAETMVPIPTACARSR